MAVWSETREMCMACLRVELSTRSVNMELICLGLSFEEKRIVPTLPVNVLPQSLQIHLCLPDEVFPFLLKPVLPQCGQQLKPVAYKVRLSKDLMQESITMLLSGRFRNPP
jgi:hypothetical protein